jgi:hypothetical protein
MADLDPAPVLDAVARDPRLRAFLGQGKIETIPARQSRRRLLLDSIAQAFEPGVAERFANVDEPLVREQVAWALVRKGLCLGRLGRAEEAIGARVRCLGWFLRGRRSGPGPSCQEVLQQHQRDLALALIAVYNRRPPLKPGPNHYRQQIPMPFANRGTQCSYNRANVHVPRPVV